MMVNKSEELQAVDALLAKLKNLIQKRYPDISPEDISQIQARIIQYLVDSFEEGFELVLVKEQGDEFIIKTLKLIEEDNEL